MSDSALPAPATTFCTCIEAGILEKQVVLLVESLRSFDTPIANSTFFVIQPRKGVPVSRRTLDLLRHNEVHYVRLDLVGHYSWYSNLNKSAAMSWLEENTDTNYITWIDSDVLFTQPPDPKVLIPHPFDFCARPGEGYLGTDGKDRNTPYWKEVSRICGTPFDQGRIIVSRDDGRNILEYYQSGLYTVRRSLRLAQTQFAFMKRLIDARIASSVAGIYHYDQVTLSLAAQACAEKRVIYPISYNYTLNSRSSHLINNNDLSSSVVLHYFDSLNAPNYLWAMNYINLLPASTRQLIEKHCPFDVSDMPWTARALRRALGEYRSLKWKRHKSQATVF